MTKQVKGLTGNPMELGKSPAPPAMKPKGEGKQMSPKAGGSKKGGGGSKGGMGSCK